MRRLLFLPASALVLCACSSGTPAAAPTAPSMARMLDVADRSVRRWIAGTAPIPDGVRVWVERIEAATADAVGQVLAAIMDEPDPTVIVYRTDEEMWGERPDSEPMPARWWRMVAARAAYEAPGLTITYLT